MTGLVRVEGRRFRYRAAVRWLAVASLLAAAVTVLGAWVSTTPPSAQEIADTQAFYEQQVADWEQHGEEQVADCREQEAAAQETDPGVDWGCDEMGPPSLEDLTGPASTFAADAPQWAGLLSTFLLLLALASGVTFVTAEFGAGSIGTWLTFVPRRGRVYASKVLVAGTGAMLPAALALVVALGGAYAAAAVHDAVGATTGDVWAGLGWQVLRTVVLAGAVGVVGAALGFALRGAAATLGVVVGWLLLVDGLLAGFVPALVRWTFRLNVAAWTQGTTTYWVEVPCDDVVSSGGGTVVCTAEEQLTAVQAAPVLAGAVVLLVVLGGLVFRRRDID
jgi:ABC-2 type transport system permease protein